MECDRCKRKMTSFSMSWFNTQNICRLCYVEERMHPDYKKAKEAVLQQESLGNMNYEGLGLPEDLRRKYENI